MLKTIQDTNYKKEIYFIHATENSTTHAFKKEVEDVVNNHKLIQSVTIYDNPLPNDTFDYMGRLSPEILYPVIKEKSNKLFYISGSGSFLNHAYSILKRFEIDDSQIKYESYEPQLNLR